ncbi:MAG: CHAD domain-containing protein [Acidobacteriia bacterium]|nr:CHAD domain-containing protein [Terriglobia bacterium]
MDNARSLALIRKLDRSLAKADEPLAPERVHLIRTTARRLEALLETRGSGADRKQRRLRKRLKRLRRKAGGVRDIDVQIAALRKLKIGRELERKARLMQALNEQRSQREQGLAKALADKDVQKVRKALHRWSAGISSAKPGVPAAPTGMGKYDEVAASLRRFASLARQVRTLTPENLHAYRTRCKRIRYVAEMAGNVPEAKRIVGQLKRMQDAAGDWHDWQTLTQTAESLFSRALESGLVAALRNVTNAKFVQARGVCQEARRALLAEYRAMLARQRMQRVLAPQRSMARRSRQTAVRDRQTEMPLPPAIPSKSAVAAGVRQAEVA